MAKSVPMEKSESRISDRVQEACTLRAQDADVSLSGFAFISQLVSAEAQANPDALAIADESDALTYRELEVRANRLANYLRLSGVGPEVLVGICLERSPEFIVTALGILKAGGAYLPLDPAVPRARIASILRDSQASLFITHRKILEGLPVGNWRLLALDTVWPDIAQHSAEPPAIELTPANLAYVIYTSGSSGEPKGVEITHGSLSNLVLWHQEAFAVTSADRATQLASPGFDAAVWEVWPYLASGASIHIPEKCTLACGTNLRDWLLHREISISFVPTALAEQLMNLTWPSKVSLRILLTGADTLRRYPDNVPFTLVNNYGPTECTVVATSGIVDSGQHPHQLPPIGRPIANTSIYILDDKLQRLPTGVAGEVHIAGPGLARGYRNRPDLTAQSFIPNPFGSQPGSRLYKTGDLASLLPDGQIAFVGRVDEQVKIRGHRVEPNEIAATLEKHPDVQSSVVVLRDDGAAGTRLVAYVVLTPNSQATETDLKVLLGNYLPTYMIPSMFVQVDSFPITVNGKIDRAALPAPDAANRMRDKVFLAPRTLVEEWLVAILCPLLQLDKISVEDNFFMMGGHSLLGTQLIARIRDTFGVEISLRSLFDNPTVSGISAEIEHLILARLAATGGAQFEGKASQVLGLGSQ